MSAVQHKLQDLSSGYIKEEFIQERDDKWPVELNKIIMHFLGNIFIKFDVIPDDKCKEHVQEDGKLVNIPNHNLENAHNYGSLYCIDLST